MIDDKFIEAYNFLTPVDQMIVRELILSLYDKCKANHTLTRAMMKMIESKNVKEEKNDR